MNRHPDHPTVDAPRSLTCTGHDGGKPSMWASLSERTPRQRSNRCRPRVFLWPRGPPGQVFVQGLLP